jgi:hypothetical protein
MNIKNRRKPKERGEIGQIWTKTAKWGRNVVVILCCGPKLMMCELYPLVDVPPTSRCVRTAQLLEIVVTKKHGKLAHGRDRHPTDKLFQPQSWDNSYLVPAAQPERPGLLKPWPSEATAFDERSEMQALHPRLRKSQMRKHNHSTQRLPCTSTTRLLSLDSSLPASSRRARQAPPPCNKAAASPSAVCTASRVDATSRRNAARLSSAAAGWAACPCRMRAVSCAKSCPGHKNSRSQKAQPFGSSACCVCAGLFMR